MIPAWMALPTLLLGTLALLRLRALRHLEALEPWVCGDAELIHLRDGAIFTRRNFRSRPQGIPTLFIHGLGASSYCWRKILPQFGQHHEWIAPDLVGFGLSSKNSDSSYDLNSQTDRIIDLLDQLDIPQVHVVGSSLGGALGLWLRNQYPERFVSWIGVSPALSPAMNPQTILRQFGRRLPVPGAVIRWFRILINEATVTISIRFLRGAVTPLTSEERLRILGPYLDGGDSLVCFVKSLRLLADRRLKAAWRETSGSLTLVWGQQDRLLPVSQVPALVKGKQMELRILAKSAHHPMEDEPEAFLALLREKIPSRRSEHRATTREPLN